MLKRLLIPLSAVCLLVSCGDESSSNSSTQPEFVESSSSLEQEVESSSSEKLSSSSAKESSSSVKQTKTSSSSVKGSSSSKKKESSSSQSSSSEKKQESSSSENKSSSNEPKGKSSSSSTISSSSSEKNDSSSSSSINISVSSESESSSSEYSSSSVQETSSSSSEESSSSSFVGCIMGTLYDDRDGKTYKTVRIGEQEWMAENLNYDVQNYESSYRSWCFDNKDGSDGEVDNCQKYGRLYRWSAAIDSLTLAQEQGTTCGYNTTGVGICVIPNNWKGICPDGWHLPTEQEWETGLVRFVGGSDIAGKKLKSSEGWDLIGGVNGSDELCFSGLPAGYRNGSGKFATDYTYFWTADKSKNLSYRAYAMGIPYQKDVLVTGDRDVGINAYSIRCVKN